MSVAFALNCYAPLGALLPAGLVGLTAHAVYAPIVAADLGSALVAAVAAIAVGILSFSLAGRFQVPPLVLVVSGIVGLLPGLTIYRGLFQLLTIRDAEGFFLMLTAASIAVGLAAGVLLGEYIAQPLKREARKLETRLAGPRLVGRSDCRTVASGEPANNSWRPSDTVATRTTSSQGKNRRSGVNCDFYFVGALHCLLEETRFCG
ncbi:MAG: threonine/serine exporter family protein [Actinomycetota bacterium]|nr:threonine/serine exporter family protein [Actinomycetota bacterium]